MTKKLSQEEMIRSIYEAISPQPKTKDQSDKELGDRIEAHLNRKKLKRLLKQGK